MALFVDFVFVGVEKIGGGIGVVSAGDFVEGVRGEFVVVVKKRDEFTGGELEGRVGGGGDVTVFWAEADFDAGVGGGVFLEQRTDVGRGRGVVGEAEFPVRISLFADGGDGFGEPLFRSVVDGDENGDERATREVAAAFALGAEAVVIERVVGGDPALVGGEFGEVEIGADVEVVFEENLPAAVGVADFEDDVGVAVAEFDFDFPPAVFGLGFFADGGEDVHTLQAISAWVSAAVDGGADVFEGSAVVSEAPAAKREFARGKGPAVREIDAERQGAFGGGLESREGGGELRELGHGDGRGVAGGKCGRGPARVDERAAEGTEGCGDFPGEAGLELADFFITLANDLFAMADGGEVIAQAFADLGEGAGARISEGGALGAELVDLVVGEIDLVLKLGADALETIDFLIKRGHLRAGGGEEGFGLLALDLAAAKLRAKRVEGFLEIGRVGGGLVA